MDPLQQLHADLVEWFRDYAFHCIAFDNEDEAIGFYNKPIFIPEPDQGEKLGVCPENMIMRIVRFEDGVDLVVAGHLSMEQNYEILLKGLSERREMTNLSPSKSGVASPPVRAFLEAGQKIQKDHPELISKQNKTTNQEDYRNSWGYKLGKLYARFFKHRS